MNYNYSLAREIYTQPWCVDSMSYSALTTLLKSQFDFNPTKIITKFDGRPFYPEELNEKLK